MTELYLSFSSESRLINWFKEKRREAGNQEAFEKWLQEFFDAGSKVSVDGTPCGYWACWGAGILGERPVVENWELDMVYPLTTNEIKNRIWRYVSCGYPIPGCVSLLALRIELLNRSEDPTGYHNT